MQTDFLLGLLKKTLSERKDDFRLIITSATIDAQKFSSFFFNCKIMKIEGRSFPVEILYSLSFVDDYV